MCATVTQGFPAEFKFGMIPVRYVMPDVAVRTSWREPGGLFLAERVDDPADTSSAVDDDDVKAQPGRAPIRMFRQHQLGRGQQPGALTRAECRGRGGEVGTRLHLDDGEQPRLLGDDVDLAGRRPEAAGEDPPAIRKQRRNRTLLRRDAVALAEPAAFGAVEYHRRGVIGGSGCNPW